MGKGKKKKDVDFQKVKLKIGRRLKRDDNETRAEFKTRKIILKEVKSFSKDPVTTLIRHSDRISVKGKISMLNHFNSALTPEFIRTLNKPVLDSLSKFMLDQSEQVRQTSIKCLKTCYNQLKQQHLSREDFIQDLKPYLDCAYTHVSSPIVNDCQKFLEYFATVNDPQTFETLLTIVLRRYKAGNLSESEKKLALKLKHLYLRHKQKQAVEHAMKEDQMEPLIWSETNYFLDLDRIIYRFDEENTLGEEQFDDSQLHLISESYDN